LIYVSYSRYIILRDKRNNSYFNEPNEEDISLNWGRANIIYKYIDKKGYTKIYEKIRIALRSKFDTSIVDEKFIEELYNMLDDVLSKPLGM
jgi:hypothetical protein